MQINVCVTCKLPLEDWLATEFVDSLRASVRAASAVLPAIESLQQNLHRLRDLLQYRAMVRGLKDAERKVLDAILTDPEVSDGNWCQRVELSVLVSWTTAIERQSPILQSMSGRLYEARRAELKDALSRKRMLEAKAILAGWGSRWEKTDVQWRKSLAVKGKTARRLREIVELWGDKGLLVLRPCWLTHPGTASQLFRLEPGLFDAVIFDEASQCPPEYAVPALYRGHRAIVAGDGKQLPPTMFFRSSFDFESEDDEPSEDESPKEVDERHEIAVSTGSEDLLALAQARLPEAHLNVHYRSMDPTLISFSNAAFYGNRLQTPSPASVNTPDGKPALYLERVDGLYTQTRTNPTEADRVVEYVRGLWTKSPAPPTLGIVTFNEPQQQAILDRVDDLARKDAGFRTAFERESSRRKDGQDVGFFVKNLEAVQGDERDVIVFSTTYGRRDDRAFTRAFLGPLNRDGGERRLNVAISRARLWVRIFTSMPIEQIAEALTPGVVPNGSGMGRSMLQLYLAYADHIGIRNEEAAEAILERAFQLGGHSRDGAESVGVEDSEFEVDVRGRLNQALNLRIDSQVGSGAFRIDLGVRHPRDESSYVLGIECDGKAYHSAPTARAYDLWRQRILEERGWRIHRIWSTAWRNDPAKEIAKIEEILSCIQ